MIAFLEMIAFLFSFGFLSLAQEADTLILLYYKDVKVYCLEIMYAISINFIKHLCTCDIQRIYS